MINPSVRKVTQAEREKERKKERKKEREMPLIVDT